MTIIQYLRFYMLQGYSPSCITASRSAAGRARTPIRLGFSLRAARRLQRGVSQRACLVFPIHLLLVANDLVIAGPRSRAHDPSCSDCHGPALACDVGAVNANRTRQPSRAIVADQNAVSRVQGTPLTALTVRQDVHRPGSGNRRGTNRVKRSATAWRNDK